MIRIIKSSNRAAVEELLTRHAARRSEVERRVRGIISAVRKNGDAAVQRYARRFDGWDGAMELTPDEVAREARRTSSDVRAAIRAAARNIRLVARAQVPATRRTTVAPGIVIEHRVTPLERVACYVPAGRYPLPSSLLMTAIPARAAGVPEVVVACPRPTPEICAAAVEAKVDRFFRVGGAHAVAGLAYGTKTLPRVDKIVGPGSAYVAAAKTLVSQDCSIDFHAGPSEIVIISRRGRAAWLAADLLAQAEHDVDARAILVTPNARLAEAVQRAVAARMPAEGPAREAIAHNGGIIVVNDLDEALDLAARLAPEHLECDDAAVAARVRCAGTVFVGPHAAQALGDYATGSNHVLPTGGVARFRGGLSAADFVRVMSVQHISARGLKALAPTVVALAVAEGLTAHAASVIVRVS